MFCSGRRLIGYNNFFCLLSFLARSIYSIALKSNLSRINYCFEIENWACISAEMQSQLKWASGQMIHSPTQWPIFCDFSQFGSEKSTSFPDDLQRKFRWRVPMGIKQYLDQCQCKQFIEIGFKSLVSF